MFDTLNWDDLRVFLHAARAGNLSQTAKRMRLDHSTVSRRIAQMEASLGIAVFERHRTGLKLNEIGERLLRHAEKVESAVIAIHEEASIGDTEGLAGTVRLATMEGIASLYLAQRFSNLRQTMPQLTVELVTSAQTVYVHKREADLFVSFFQPPGPGLISERIGKFGLGLYASRGYLDGHGTPESLRDLAEALVRVLYRGPDPGGFGALARRRHRGAPHRLPLQQHDRADERGRGRSRHRAVAELRNRGRPDLIPVLPGLASTSREVWLNVHGDLQFAPRIRAVRAFLRNTLKNDPDMQVGLSAMPQIRTADCKNP